MLLKCLLVTFCFIGIILPQFVPNCSYSTAVTTFNQYYEGISATTVGGFTITIDMKSTTSSIPTNSVIMIIQMQGGTINPTDSSNYGGGVGFGGTGYLTNNAGFYEFNIVQSAIYQSATLFNLQLLLPLENAYSSSGNNAFQVLTVPLCNTATFLNNNIVSIPWDGKTGGIISLLAYQDITVDNSIISASSQGFRGAPDYDVPTSDPSYPTNFFASPIMMTSRTGFKGEGFIGYPTFGSVATNYPFSWDCGMGAPGNAGGGGNSIDSGGAGGSNGGNGGSGGDAGQIVPGTGIVNVPGGIGAARITPFNPLKLYFGTILSYFY